eukprot:TRINITY_DN94417_c0_g1_i1.p1 TRINITY_DN94417_c0_g1~~TRINITY_DN94417_c0_g1_i1.p1  ORF type:complete len:964 (+),score=198.92 TRINITY_DN94417_c0_g1_i1:84-2975(+)
MTSFYGGLKTVVREPPGLGNEGQAEVGHPDDTARPRDRTGLRGVSKAEGQRQWYSPEELNSFILPEDNGCSNGGSTFLSSGMARSTESLGPSFYGKGPQLVMPKPPPPPKRPPPQRSNAPDFDEISEQVSSGRNVYIMPKRPPRANECYALDKEFSACNAVGEVLDLAQREAKAMDAANWANLFYALAHFKKKGSLGSSFSPAALRADQRWSISCESLRPKLAELTARDSANVLWSLATLDARQESVFVETADSLCSGGKLAVCDPVSVSKAAWALTTVPNRDKRLELYSKLAVPVVLRAESFPLGALTMICYSFAKADFREGDAYESLSSALSRHMNEEMRPIDVCNIVWSFCTVGYRDDVLFAKICEMHLCREEVVQNFNPQDLTNTTWGFCKVGFMHRPAMDTLAKVCLDQRHRFEAIHFSNLLYSFAMLRLQGPDGVLRTIADTAAERIHRFDGGNLAIAIWALAMLGLKDHRLLSLALAQAARADVAPSLGSRALSMMVLACFRTARPDDLDRLFDATRAAGLGIGASGYSAAVMAAEQGSDASREIQILQAMANEADDDRMRAAVANSLAVRLWKRGRPAEAFGILRALRSSNPKRWSVVSAALVARLAGESGALEEAAMMLAETGGSDSGEWEAPVKSGIHPMAATRQNEGGHAYTREFMTLQAVLCGAPPGDPDACMAAVERFAESRSLWLKITAWEKAIVVHEVARLTRPRVAVEIGAYVGYSAMNIAKAVRTHGGRVASLEVDPMHVTVVRNMLEYAGLSDTVDVWTGYCYDVIPHLLQTYGLRSIDMVFMDQKGTRFHSDLELMEELQLLSDGAVILADNVLKPGAPLYIWHLAKGKYHHCTAVSVREFLLQSEDWMVMGFHDASREPAPTPPPDLHRLAFESDAFRKRSMFDGVAPSKSDWWKFSQGFVDGLDRCGCKPQVVGLHGRENPKITPEDIERIFRNAGALRESG